MKDNKLIFNLFQEAQETLGEQYLFALLRVGPIESYTKDPFLVFKDSVINGTVAKKDVILAKEFWGFITNLSKIAGKYPYNPYVFWVSEGDNYIEESKKLIRKDLGSFLDQLFPTDDTELNKEQLSFLRDFFKHFDDRIKDFVNDPVFIPRPRFEVLELLTKKTQGLYGFRLHFSNGSHAEYTRDEKGTNAVNIMPESSGVGFMVGNLDELKEEWRVGEKRLYEINEPGRYNDSGKWMPIVYPGKPDHLQDEALKATEDERIQGTLFYMFCTGYRAIEFAARMNIKLPEDKTILPGGVFLELVPQDDPPELGRNEYVYDGTILLDDGKVETIKKGLDVIQRCMDGIAFTFDNPVKWQVKYTIKGHSPATGLPLPEDIKILNKLVESTLNEDDMVIDTAINWFKLGLLTDNKLNSFLCFCIAVEGLAVKLANGQLKASKFFKLEKEDKNDRKKRIKTTFDEYYEKYYPADLEKLINDSYFHGVGPITSSMKKSFKAVFGERSPIIKEYFQGPESINAIRGKLAHGEYSDWHYEEYMKVWEKLGDLREIVKSFIIRVLLRVPPEKKRPTWSRHHSFSMGMDRPTGTLFVSRIDILPKNDWKIKADWIE